MKSSRHTSPIVNAGSMADIAFLLLIFFLISTTISADEGINRKLPKNCPPGIDCNLDANQRNVLNISLNEKDEIFVKDAVVPLSELKPIVIQFLDNNGDKTCNYCHGESKITSSDHPKKAIISLKANSNTTYNFYVAVQNELTHAYYDLRSAYALETFGKAPNALTKEELKAVKEAYPFTLSEAEIK